MAYKGTDFHGWQIQPDVISIQETIQNALGILLKNPTNVIGAGRTDTGVHARQLFAHFDTQISINEQKTAYKLNALLPPTIVIKQIIKVPDEAHARFNALWRSYEYHVYLLYDPFLLDTVWQIPHRNFDIEEMNKAAKILLKHTDFKAFSKSKTDVAHYDCTVTQARWIQKGKHLIFYITANRFLRNMVRTIVGSLLEIGEGKLYVADFEEVINSRERSNAGVSVPARGLVLTRIKYPAHIIAHQ